MLEKLLQKPVSRRDTLKLLSAGGYLLNAAGKNNYSSSVVNPLYSGDVDGDGIVSIADAIRIQRVAIGAKPTGLDFIIADTTGDGVINALDFIKALRCALGYDEPVPVTLKVRVTGLDNDSALEGANVRITNVAGNELYIATTSADGIAPLVLFPSGIVSIEHPLYVTHTTFTNRLNIDYNIQPINNSNGYNNINFGLLPKSLEAFVNQAARSYNGKLAKYTNQFTVYHDIRGSKGYDGTGENYDTTSPAPTQTQRDRIEKLAKDDISAVLFESIPNPIFVEGINPPLLFRSTERTPSHPYEHYEVPDGYFLVRRNDSIPDGAVVDVFLDQNYRVRSTLLEYRGLSNGTISETNIVQDGLQGLGPSRDVTTAVSGLQASETVFHTTPTVNSLQPPDIALFKLLYYINGGGGRPLGNTYPDNNP